MKNIKKIVYGASALVAMATAPLPASAQWTEKYPVTPIVETNVISTYLKANFGKIGEIAAKRIESFLNDPVQQAKMAAKIIQYIGKLAAETHRSEDERAKELLAKIDEEIAALKAQGYVGSPTGSLNTYAAFAPSFNVMKLTWQADRPGPFTCQLYDSRRPFGQQIYWVDVLQEADYRIYRNGRLIATLAGTNNGAGSKEQSVSYSGNGFSLTLSVSLPKAPQPGEVVFYDYDPYQGAMGTPLRYQVVAERQGCGAFLNNSGPAYTGRSVIQTEFYVDAGGDSIPDFVPQSVVQSLRAAPADPTPPQEPVALPGSGNYRLLAGADCYCAGSQSVALPYSWMEFSRRVDADLVKKTGVGTSGWPEISAALAQCQSTLTSCTVGSVTIKKDFSANSVNGFRNFWLLLN